MTPAERAAIDFAVVVDGKDVFCSVCGEPAPDAARILGIETVAVSRLVRELPHEALEDPRSFPVRTCSVCGDSITVGLSGT